MTTIEQQRTSVVECSRSRAGGTALIRVIHRQGRSSVRAYAHDLKTFFRIIAKDPVEVRARDVLGFVTAQQRARVGAENVARVSDGRSRLSAATVRRRLAAVSAFCGYLIARGDVGVETNPVPRGLPTRRRRRDGRGQPLVRSVRRLPLILDPGEVAALLGALRTERERAMVLGGLRRCEVLGLRLEDSAAERVAGVHRRGQGRPSMAGAAVDDLLHYRRRVHELRAADRRDGPGVGRVEGSQPGLAAHGRRFAVEVSGAASNDEVIEAGRRSIEHLLGLRSCVWRPDYHGTAGPVLRPDGNLDAGGSGFAVGATEGGVLPTTIELPVEPRGYELGRFVLQSSPDRGVSIEERRVGQRSPA